MMRTISMEYLDALVADAVRAERELCIRDICLLCANDHPVVLKPHVYRTIPVWVHEGEPCGPHTDYICPGDPIRRRER